MTMQSFPKTLCDVDAEKALLAAIMLDNAKLPAISQKVRSQDFFIKSHQIIYQVMLEMNAKSMSIDLLTLKDTLESAQQLEIVGGAPYIASLADVLFRPANIHKYSEILRRKSVQRDLANRLDRFAKRVVGDGSDLNLLLDELSGIPSDLRSRVPGCEEERIESWQQIPVLAALPKAHVAWVVDRLIPEDSLVLMAGAPGSYKTWLSLVLAREVATGGLFLGRKCRQREVVIFDRENPLALICERRDLLGMSTDETIRIWGSWERNPPPSIGDPRLLRIARERKPLIIVDSFIRFHNADENSATEMAPVMADLRALANAGASVVLLHHRTKADSSYYRGSSDILGGVDVALSISRDKNSGIISIECFKTRFTDEFELSLLPELAEKQDFVVVDSTEAERERVDVDKLAALMEERPKINQSDILAEKLMPVKRCLALLQKYVGSRWTVEPGPRNSRQYTALPAFIIED
jgi:hypothetical protein